MRKLLFFLLLLPLSVFGQASLTDSLFTQLSEAKSDSHKVELHYQLGRHYFLSDVKKGFYHAKSARVISSRIGYKAGEAKSLNLLGYAQVILGEYDKALSYYFRSLKIAQETEADDAIIVAYNSIGSVYFRINDNQRALNYYEQSLELALKADDKLGISKVYNNLGNVYESQKDFDLALNYFKQAASLQKEFNHTSSLAISLYNIGNLHLNLEEPKDGLPYLFESLELNQEVGNKMIMVGTLKSISNIYLVSGDKSEALTYALRSYDMAQETGSNKKIADASWLLQDVYAAMGKHALAHQFLKVYVEQQQLLNIENQQKVSQELSVRFETEKKELENQKLKAENALQATILGKQRLFEIFGGVIILFMLGTLIVLDVNRRRIKDRNEKLKRINNHVHAKNLEISSQRSEISSQALALQEKNQELEQNSYFKNKLFSIISHDLRNPFHSIKGMLQVIQRRGISEQDLQYTFKILYRDVELVQNMLNNLLLWSKAQLDGSSVVSTPLSLHSLVSENMALLTSQANEKGVQLLNLVQQEAFVLADQDRLHFVVRNLLSNAIKFSYPGGEVIVTTEIAGTEVSLSIKDNGKGISEKNLVKLFSNNRFTTPGTAKEKGTGLGLMFCKDFVESMRGTLQVTSKETRGSVFIITLSKADIAQAFVANPADHCNTDSELQPV
ncbi:sensor histidine kinase [Pontibacter qinzhouensis]|uniref:histidine kinase n=1 Tax=Pontibacter qinzhouensis TaxID=2603253 RepID=A0A5C8IU82_9BACT|nr:tetratricopeptide repeat-containing sensor histidine kinase [Pontibacter qinzhouensis]TXK24681.1 sensor histidine kinase [Pontibacter qinzhouensis]